MKIDLPKGEYIKNIVVNDDNLEILFEKRKKVALCLIGINQNYWTYLAQVIQDCKHHFLPQHKVDYLVWTDIPEEDTKEHKESLNNLLPQEAMDKIYATGGKPPHFFSREAIQGAVNYIRDLKEATIIPTGAVEWPAPTLMRYNLFLGEEEKLKEYDYIYYLDADMRVVAKVSDEIMGEGLTAAPHPGYEISKKFLPPLEPNKDSTAYIHRLGRIVEEEGGKKRFKPFYAAGGMQGGRASVFIEAMKEMRGNIDKDFDNGYIAIWNDESHWNKYLWDFQKKGGDITFLDVSYIYPDSLIKEYYEPLWGCSYEPKIITLTKPFSLSKQSGAEINQMLGGGSAEHILCPQCGDIQQYAGHKILRVVTCPGKGQAHQVEMQKL